MNSGSMKQKTTSSYSRRSDAAHLAPSVSRNHRYPRRPNVSSSTGVLPACPGGGLLLLRLYLLTQAEKDSVADLEGSFRVRPFPALCFVFLGLASRYSLLFVAGVSIAYSTVHEFLPFTFFCLCFSHCFCPDFFVT